MAERDFEEWLSLGTGEDVISGANDAGGHFSEAHTLYYPENGPTTVGITKKPGGRTATGGPHPHGESILRVNHPHACIEHSHVSFNSQTAGRANPHVRIPDGAPQVARTGAKAATKVGKVLGVAGTAIDVKNTVCSGYQDYQHGTTRNTVENFSDIGGGFAGAEAGGWLGASIGSRSGNPLVALVSGIFGAVAGGLAGSYGAESVAETIGDHYEYNMNIITCASCGKQFLAKTYKGEKMCRSCTG